MIETGKIINGDCIEVMKTLPEGSVDLVVTSPPYGVGIAYDVHEDDVEFRPFASVLFKEWWKGVPEDWDMVYLGGNHFGCDSRLKNAPRIVPVTKHIYRTSHTLACHAFVIKNTMYDHMIENLNKLENTNDMVYAQAQTKFNVYIFKPNFLNADSIKKVKGGMSKCLCKLQRR